MRLKRPFRRQKWLFKQKVVYIREVQRSVVLPRLQVGMKKKFLLIFGMTNLKPLIFISKWGV